MRIDRFAQLVRASYGLRKQASSLEMLNALLEERRRTLEHYPDRGEEQARGIATLGLAGGLAGAGGGMLLNMLRGKDAPSEYTWKEIAPVVALGLAGAGLGGWGGKKLGDRSADYLQKRWAKKEMEVEAMKEKLRQQLKDQG